VSSFEKRRRALSSVLKTNGIAMALFEDTEGRRDPSVRYFTGQPGDALLFISADDRSLLVPWDVNMAASMASVETIVAYADYGRSPLLAMAGAVGRLEIPVGTTIDLPSVTPYPMFIDYLEACPDHDFRCVSEGSTKAAQALRAVKDAEELQVYRTVSSITDKAMDQIEAGVRAGRLATEADIALFIERFLRQEGCESTGFETLAAGPSRSFGIHAFPAWTNAAFATDGMSILDFGLSFKGYTSDVTMTFVRNAKSGKRAEMIALVQEAHDKAIAACKPGAVSREVAALVDAIFSSKGYTMPHALGHGVGLEAHEAPAVRNREDNDWVLAAGHIITIEPGLYDPAQGGVRLEDDVLITESGAEVLTHSRIVQLD